MKTATKIGLALASLALAAGCGHDNFKDLKGVRNVKPDSIVNIENMDRHPNIGKVCYDGVAFATTSRNYGDAIMRVPEWDKTCPAVQR